MRPGYVPRSNLPKAWSRVVSNEAINAPEGKRHNGNERRRVMAKYRKRPVVIEATQWHPGMAVDGVCFKHEFDGAPTECPKVPHIHTLEGPMMVSAGDWIITGVKGEKYPCKPDIFAATYEPADAATSRVR
jgi:hypothetical protein